MNVNPLIQGKSMQLNTRNILKGKAVDLKEGRVMAKVKVDSVVGTSSPRSSPWRPHKIWAARWAMKSAS